MLGAMLKLLAKDCVGVGIDSDGGNGKKLVEGYDKGAVLAHTEVISWMYYIVSK